MLAGTMNHDDGYQFLRIGRNLERADMTSRIIDVRTSGGGAGQTRGESANDHVQWLSVLQSLSAEHMYRRTVQVRIQREAVLRFLILDPLFPRAISHCLNEIERSVRGLSGDSGTEAVLQRLQDKLTQGHIEAMGAADLHRFLDQIQLELGQAHDAVAERFFLPLAGLDQTHGL